MRRPRQVDKGFADKIVMRWPKPRLRIAHSLNPSFQNFGVLCGLRRIFYAGCSCDFRKRPRTVKGRSAVERVYPRRLCSLHKVHRRVGNVVFGFPAFYAPTQRTSHLRYDNEHVSACMGISELIQHRYILLPTYRTQPLPLPLLRAPVSSFQEKIAQVLLNICFFAIKQL